MSTPVRWLADVDALLLDVLIPALNLPPGNVGEQFPADVLIRVGTGPVVQAHRVGGAPVHRRFLDEAVCDLQVMAVDKTSALNYAEACGVALYTAWERQAIYPHGSIASFEEQAAPVQVPDDADAVTRLQATYRLGICPPL